MSHPPEEYVEGSSCEHLQKDDNYQDANELVQVEKSEQRISHVSSLLK